MVQPGTEPGTSWCGILSSTGEIILTLTSSILTGATGVLPEQNGYVFVMVCVTDRPRCHSLTFHQIHLPAMFTISTWVQ